MVAVRIVGNEVPEPSIQDITWKAWLNNQSTTLSTGNESYFISYAGNRPSGYAWEYVLIINLAFFPSWVATDVLNLNVSCKNVSGKEWKEVIGTNSKVSLGYVEDPEKFIVFDTVSKVQVMGCEGCKKSGDNRWGIKSLNGRVVEKGELSQLDFYNELRRERYFLLNVVNCKNYDYIWGVSMYGNNALKWFHNESYFMGIHNKTMQNQNVQRVLFIENEGFATIYKGKEETFCTWYSGKARLLDTKCSVL